MATLLSSMNKSEINMEDPYDANYVEARNKVLKAKENLDSMVENFFVDSIGKLKDKEKFIVESAYTAKMNAANSQLKMVKGKIM